MSSTYELTVVYSAKLSEDKIKKATKALDSLVKKEKGKVIKSDNWGKRELAYPISKETEGYYVHRLVELPNSGPRSITEKIRMDEAVLRYLLVKPEEDKKKTKKKTSSKTKLK